MEDVPKRARIDPPWTDRQVKEMLKSGVLLQLDVMEIIWAYEAYPNIRQWFIDHSVWDQVWVKKLQPMYPQGTVFTHFGHPRRNCLAWYIAQRYAYQKNDEKFHVLPHFVKNTPSDDRVYVTVFMSYEDFPASISCQCDMGVLQLRGRALREIPGMAENSALSISAHSNGYFVWAPDTVQEFHVQLAHLIYIILDMGFYAPVIAMGQNKKYFIREKI